MKNEISKLECTLEEIFEAIAQNIEIAEIDLEEFEKMQKPSFARQEDFEEYINEFKSEIIYQKNNPIQKSKSLLEIRTIVKDALANLDLITNSSKLHTDGDKGTPSRRFLTLLDKKIINPNTEIRGEYKGKIVTGIINQDGYFEVSCEGHKREFNSLRKAAWILLNYSTPINAWEFWKIGDLSIKEYEQKIY